MALLYLNLRDLIRRKSGDCHINDCGCKQILQKTDFTKFNFIIIKARTVVDKFSKE